MQSIIMMIVGIIFGILGGIIGVNKKWICEKRYMELSNFAMKT